ncbi:DUF4238 domain-containing protein [Lysobacter tyrosinilyticus]
MHQFRKDNHYVPKVYLKQWVTGGVIPTYRLLVQNDACPLWRSHSLKGVAYRQHLYTYLIGDEATDEFERWLDSEFEGPAEEAIDRVIREQRLTKDHWRRLARFAVAQDARTPARLKEFLARQAKLMPDLMDRIVLDTARQLEDSVERATLAKKTLAISKDFPLKVSVGREADGKGTLSAKTVVGRRLWIWSLRHLLTNTIEKLPTNRWTILHAPEGVSWPTTDNPLVRLNFFSPSNYNFDGGWGVPNGDILLPLSPKHLLFACIGRKSWVRGTKLNLSTALLIRRMIIEHGDRYVFAKEPGDIHLIRPRIVSPDGYKAEQEAWKKWHSEQTQSEIELHR